MDRGQDFELVQHFLATRIFQANDRTPQCPLCCWYLLDSPEGQVFTIEKLIGRLNRILPAIRGVEKLFIEEDL